MSRELTAEEKVTLLNSLKASYENARVEDKAVYYNLRYAIVCSGSIILKGKDDE